MKKADIREGVTYQTKNGSAARRVIKITDDASEVLDGDPSWTEGWVIYKQIRGVAKGMVRELTLPSFAAWAHSEETAVASTDLAARISQLEAACEMALETLIGCVRPGPGCDDAAAIKQAVDQLRVALDDTRTLPAPPGSIAARMQDRKAAGR